MAGGLSERHGRCTPHVLALEQVKGRDVCECALRVETTLGQRREVRPFPCNVELRTDLIGLSRLDVLFLAVVTAIFVNVVWVDGSCQ